MNNKKLLSGVSFDRLTPVQIILILYAAASIIGSVLLKLPVSNHQPISYLDALFTATSAVCVTGLIVVDTGTQFTLAGQIIILTLFQIGGIGIMTLGVVFTSILVGRISFKDRSVIRQSFAHFGVSNFRKLLLEIVIFTLLVELIGALLLYRLIWEDGFFNALFHAVSAFCNAGFSLYENSFMDFSGNAALNLVVCCLIVIGGIGFIVTRDLRLYIFRRTKRLSLHSKIVLTMSSILLLAGTLAILAFEWNNSFESMPIYEKLIASLFQSTTARTAGFNTVDLNLLSSSSIFIIIILMFIGASPGSCGGGIKTTTLAVLLSYVKNRAQGVKDAFIFKRTIPTEIVSKTVTVVTASLLSIFLVTITLATVEGWGKSYADNPNLFTEALFEAVSSFATVGLSLGITGELSTISKIVVIITMLAGRVGPLAVAIAIGGQKQVKLKYAEEKVMVG